MGDEDFNVTDQDTLSAEDSAELAKMQAADLAADDGDGGDGQSQSSQQQQAKKPAAQPAPQKGGQSQNQADGANGEGEDAPQGRGKPLSPEALAAVREERARTKALRDELAASNKRFETLEQRTNLLLERIVPKQEAPKEEPAPDINVDPVGWIAHQMRATGKGVEELAAQVAQIREKDQQTEEQNRQRTAVNAVISAAAQAEREFKATTPDYDEAGAFLHQSRVEELQDMGYTDQQVAYIINNERVAIAQKAFEDGKNPAEVVYAIAKRRGFKAGAKANTDSGGQQQQQIDPKEKLDNLKRGAEQSQSLSDTAGQGPAPMTAKRLLEMSEAEFSAWTEANPKEARNLMGA